MKQSITLPMADKFYHDQQDSAYIRSVNVSWEIPEEISNTATTAKTGTPLTADFQSSFRAKNFLYPTH